MAYTDPVVPPTAIGQVGPVQVSDYTDGHRKMHARYITGGIENVRSHGAVGNGSTDDTNAFLKAINNLKARSVFGAGKLYVPLGFYVCDGDAILAALTGLEGFVIQGDGPLQTNIQAKGGASCGFGWDSMVNSVVRDITFAGATKGGGVHGFTQYGNCRANQFDHVRFNASQNGFNCVADPVTPAQDQNERNIFINCSADNNTVGYRINSGNAQGQLFLGGGSSGCDTAFWGSLGWAEFHSWFAGSSGGVGTAWKTDMGWIGTSLYSCLDEAFSVTFDLGSGTLVAERTYFQGLTYSIKGDAAAAQQVDTRYCVFTDGGLTPTLRLGPNSVFYDKHNTYQSGVVISAGTNVTRHKWANEGYYVVNSSIPGNAANATLDSTAAAFFLSANGYMDFHQTQAPATPAANYQRLYMTNGGVLTVKDAAGATHAVY